MPEVFPFTVLPRQGRMDRDQEWVVKGELKAPEHRASGSRVVLLPATQMSVSLIPVRGP